MNNQRTGQAAFQQDIYEFFCIFHRIKKLAPKEASSPANQNPAEEKLTGEQRGEQLNRSLYKILNEIESRIVLLPLSTEPAAADYFDEWAFLTWTLLSIINRLEKDADDSCGFLDYGGKHFQEKIHAALVDLVNKAQRMKPPMSVNNSDSHYERFYQAYVTSLISLHDLYTMSQQKWISGEFEAQISLFKDQLTNCFQLQRDFCNSHGYYVWNQLRTSQIQKMTRFGFNNKGFLTTAVSFYSHMLYNLGILAARLQVTMGFWNGTRTAKGASKPELIGPLLKMIYSMVEMLLSDSIICIEPSQNAILVTNNLFPTKIASLCRCTLFKEFSLQIVSEEVAQQIQQELRHRKTFDQAVPVRPSPSAALLAMKPSSGVKRNNATASDGGGNTAHKKSDVNSKEWIAVPPTFDPEHQAWIATYPHLLCTTRQKDALLDSRSAGQTGKRPLFYFHVKAEMFGFTGEFVTAHTLSMPFAIATRRNQDCQVQRMMSSYTATCFWLYGTAALDGLLLQWYDNSIDWNAFKELYAQYFSMNAEVNRSLTDEDFLILRNKMHCNECSDPTGSFTQYDVPSITFKNVLCPHLHYSLGKSDVKFSVWRGMLELLHLFSDQRTEIKTLWEAGLLNGFMERQKIVQQLGRIESGLIMHLSFVMGGCVCFAVKTANQILHLEPLDLKKLQAKSLHEYLRDILIAEKVEYFFTANQKWLLVSEAMKACPKSSDLFSQAQPTLKEITSNLNHTDAIDVEETQCFTPMRVAVVTCKSSNGGEEFKYEQEIPSLVNYSNEEFELQLDKLMSKFGKTRMDVINVLNRKAVSAAQAVPSPVHPPVTGVRPEFLSTIPSSSSQNLMNGFHPYHYQDQRQPNQRWQMDGDKNWTGLGTMPTWTGHAEGEFPQNGANGVDIVSLMPR